MTSLLTLTDDAIALQSIVYEYADAHDGDLTGVEGTLGQWFDESKMAIEAKCEAVARLTKEWEAKAKARGEEAKSLLCAAAADKARCERLKLYTKECLQRLGRNKVNAGPYVVSVQRNAGVAPLEISVQPHELPPTFHRVTVETDKELLRASLEAGAVVPGAKLGERGYSLRIR